MSDCAFLNNSGNFTAFTYNGSFLFTVSSQLLNEMNSESSEEEYIDLVPILNNLYIDADAFLKPIRKVELYN